MKQYSIILIDDEMPARNLLENYISKMANLTLLGSFSNALEALAFLQNQPVDIILTDIQMPDMSGIEFVNMVKNRAAIIFTTAYSQYALDGFDLGVVDYLLKPFELSRFSQAIFKAINFIDLQKNGEEKSAELSTFLWVKADRKMYKINYNELMYIEGQHEYVTFHTTTKNITGYYSLKNLETQLPDNQFIRIHKSYIISFQHIDSIDSNSVVIANEKLPIGENYRKNLQHWLNR